MAEKAPWEDDGLRYVVSLQDVKDINCYKDFFESEKLDDAKKECEETADKNKRSAVVYDRKVMEIVHRKVIEGEKPAEKEKVPAPKRGRKKAEPKIERKRTNADYFD